MRIITGDFKGRRLETPVGFDIRPTSDKVKEALFSILGGTMYDMVVCDLFAGTGNLGLEAISRGAEHCYFCDNAKESLAIIRRNIEYCKAEEWSTVIPGDYEKALKKLADREKKIDIFFVDPPYKNGLYEHTFELISELNLLSEDGRIIAEHRKEDKLPEEFFGFTLEKERSYGTIEISIYQKL